jgi:hypothetical protein
MRRLLLVLIFTPIAGFAQQLPTPPHPPAISTAPHGIARYQTPGDAKRECNGDVVWVNSASRVTHTANSRWYGKTKQGFYACENAALSAGYRAAHD